MKRLFIILSYFLYLTSLCFAQGQNIYYNHEGNFSFIIPKDWEQIPKEILDQHTANIKKELKSSSSKIFSIAFQRKDDSYFTHPYLLIRIDKNPISVFFLKRQLDSAKSDKMKEDKFDDVEKATNNKIKLTNMEKVEYDEASQMFLLTNENIVQGVGETMKNRDRHH